MVTDLCLLPLPHTSLRYGPLKFAGGLADEEWDVGAGEEIEVGREVFLEPIEGGAGGPVFWWGEFTEPGAGGGEHEMAAGIYEIGKSGEELLGLG